MASENAPWMPITWDCPWLRDAISTGDPLDIMNAAATRPTTKDIASPFTEKRVAALCEYISSASAYISGLHRDIAKMEKRIGNLAERKDKLWSENQELKRPKSPWEEADE